MMEIKSGASDRVADGVPFPLGETLYLRHAHSNKHIKCSKNQWEVEIDKNKKETRDAFIAMADINNKNNSQQLIITRDPTASSDSRAYYIITSAHRPDYSLRLHDGGVMFHPSKNTTREKRWSIEQHGDHLVFRSQAEGRVLVRDDENGELTTWEYSRVDSKSPKQDHYHYWCVERIKHRTDPETKKFKEAVKTWRKKPRMFGGKDTEDHPVSQVIWFWKTHHPFMDGFGVGNEAITIQRIIFLVFQIFFSYYIWSRYGAIELYKHIGCSSGCEPFLWPPPAGDPRADNSLFDPDAYPTGKEMCYPVAGSYIEDAFGYEEVVMDGQLGPMYSKPWPRDRCPKELEFCDVEWSEGSLGTWSVDIQLVYGVILGGWMFPNTHHHCYHDSSHVNTNTGSMWGLDDNGTLDNVMLGDCYWVPKDIYDSHL